MFSYLFQLVILAMTNSCANTANPKANAPYSIAKVSNSISKATNLTVSVTNSTAKSTNLTAKVEASLSSFVATLVPELVYY